MTNQNAADIQLPIAANGSISELDDSAYSLMILLIRLAGIDSLVYLG